jgi:AAA+ ATPase superfamily predicted ATPase
MRFHDREGELDELGRVLGLSREACHLTVISGRRRIGKTRLVEEFIRDREHLYFFVSRKGSRLLLEEFSAIIRDRYPRSPAFARWDDLLDHLFSLARGSLVVVFDEFQNFSRADPAVFSILQKVFDANRAGGGVHLIVAGSHMSLMHRIFRDSREPLFGRATEHMVLDPLPAEAVFAMAAELGYRSGDDIFSLFSLFGGVPKYYVALEEQGLGGRPVKEVLERGFFCQFPLFGEEVPLLLVQDFGGSGHIHFSILQAVAEGFNTLTGISDRTGVKRDSLSKYLLILRDELGILEYMVPATEDPGRSKMGRYRIRDNVTDFWFGSVLSQRSLVEGGRYSEALRTALERLPGFISIKAERLARELVRRQLPYDRVGPWWNRRGDEVDIVALNDKRGELLLGEVKWRTRPTGVKTLDELKLKSERIQWRKGSRTEKYLMVSRSGFTDGCLERMKAEDVIHWTKEYMLGMCGVKVGALSRRGRGK